MAERRKIDAAAVKDAPPLTLAQMPLDPDLLRSLGKPISELLGTLFSTPGTAQQLPSRLRLTNWNAKAGEAALHGIRKAGEEMFSASPSQLDELINAGQLDIAQPNQSAVAAIQRKLAALLGQRPITD